MEAYLCCCQFLFFVSFSFISEDVHPGNIYLFCKSYLKQP